MVSTHYFKYPIAVALIISFELIFLFSFIGLSLLPSKLLYSNGDYKDTIMYLKNKI